MVKLLDEKEFRYAISFISTSKKHIQPNIKRSFFKVMYKKKFLRIEYLSVFLDYT